MATTAGYFERKPSTAIRPGLSSIQQERAPTSPQTPQRPITSAFNSPSLSYRAEEDALVFELGSRHIASGFAGERFPRSTHACRPEQSRRVGDYRQWLPDRQRRRRKWRSTREWGSEYELWRLDIRHFDLGLFEDKLERAVREAHGKYFLQDCRSRRVILILPSILPHPALSSVLSVFFNKFQNPSVSILPSSVLSTVAAGCRSAIVVDIGWRETIMTAIDDYKEIAQRRTDRGMRKLTMETARLLRKRTQVRTSKRDVENGGDDINDADLGLCEEIAVRLSMCNAASPYKTETAEKTPQKDGGQEDTSSDPPVSVPSPSLPHLILHIPISSFTVTTEKTFFASSRDVHDIDDQEQPLHQLLFRILLSLPPDIRGTCMSRIIITGGGSHIPGLKTRLLKELSDMLALRGWDPVIGKAHEECRTRLREIDGNRGKPLLPAIDEQNTARPQNVPSQQPRLRTQEQVPDAALTKTPVLSQETSPSKASQEPQTQDEITENLARDRAKGAKPMVSGQVRGIETLGAWAGASLLSSLKVKGVVEIERDAFLQQGMAGARRDVDAAAGPSGVDSNKAKRQSLGAAAAARAAVGERKTWTLGPWA